MYRIPYIPGSMIRGVLIGRYLKRHGLRETDDILDNQSFPDVTRLFFDDGENSLFECLSHRWSVQTYFTCTGSWYKDKGVEFSEHKIKLYMILANSS
jgi:CRISPR-associated protein Csx10